MNMVKRVLWVEKEGSQQLWHREERAFLLQREKGSNMEVSGR